MKGLTLTVIFDASSLNYGEGIGNISELKKLTKNGEVYTYMSRQALRYEVFRKMQEIFGVDNNKDVPLTDENGVIQFKPSANIRDYVEVDLFGYMKTNKSKGSSTRSAVVRFSPAVSLSSMAFDIEFGTNRNFADRLNTNSNIFQAEVHSSLYTYTMTIDLDMVGVDPNDGIELDNKERARRVHMVLDVLKILDREIRGRTENLSPLFVIGGVYPIKNPLFLGRIKVDYNRDQRKYNVNTDILESVLNLELNGNTVRDYTSCGLLKGFWANEDYIMKNLNEKSINDFFGSLKAQSNEYYGV